MTYKKIIAYLTFNVKMAMNFLISFLKWQLCVRLAYIQVGGGADGAADAAPSPARCRARAPKPSARPNRKQNKTERKARRPRSRPAEPLGIGCRFSRRARLSFIGFYRSCVVPLQDGALCNFRQQFYYFGAYLPDIFAFYPASEAVEKEYFPVL